ncbi:MAG: YihA family ribosome biogenesis GTP-binding protein [Ignavibacteria bacterium]|nr:YihA family ribosome biogenesis GTP-binding protein [Ignavibacteria bacterium]
MFESVQFTGSYNDISSLKERLPEIVIAGRSNAGKSSFINHLTGKPGLARVSSTPGKTQTLNYIKIDNSFYFVDLPGYGYAKVSKKERDAWGRFILKFFNESDMIKLVIHLVDSRVTKSEHDIDFHNFCKSLNAAYVILLTKTDKLNQSELSRSMKQVSETFPGLKMGESIFPYTIKSGKFKKNVISAIKDHLNR